MVLRIAVETQVAMCQMDFEFRSSDSTVFWKYLAEND